MCENAYLSIKNPKASRALKRALDPGHRMLASLCRQLSASEAGAPPLTKSWIRTWYITLQEHQRIRTNATVSKDSDFSILMVVYEIFFFTFFKQISEINK